MSTKAREAFWDVALGNNTKLSNLAKLAIKEAEEEALAKQEQGEPEMVRNMRMWVTALKSVSDNGQHMKIPSGLSSGTCWELAIALEKFIDTTPQPKQEQGEPVAWMASDDPSAIETNPPHPELIHQWIPLYTTPQQRKPLTVEQIAEIIGNMKFITPSRIARAIEVAHGIKE